MRNFACGCRDARVVDESGSDGSRARCLTHRRLGSADLAGQLDPMISAANLDLTAEDLDEIEGGTR
jgi:hypothetical protein